MDKNDKYVIICPVCEKRLDSYLGADHDKLWSLHVDNGDCQRYQEETKNSQATKPTKC